MKEVKNFFDDEASLNRGYSKREVYNKNITNKFESIFPSIDVVQAFEEMHPGSVEKITKLAVDEQKHRHAMEKATLAIYEKGRRFGQFFGVLSIAIISYATITLSKMGKDENALVFCISAFVAIFGVSLFSYIKFNDKNSRNNFRPRHNNQRHHPKRRNDQRR